MLRGRTYLKQGMTSDDSQEPLQALSPSFDNLVGEPVGEDFAGERRDVDACGFAFENVTEGFEIRVAAADERVAQFEGGDIGLLSFTEYGGGRMKGDRLLEWVGVVRGRTGGLYLAHDLIIGVHLPTESYIN